MEKLSDAQIAKNKAYSAQTGKKLDEHGRIIVAEKVNFQINASISKGEKIE